MADSIDGAQNHVDQVGRYMNKLSMTLNLLKLSSFLIQAIRKTWIVRDPSLSIDEAMVPDARPSSVLKYLGIHYTLTEGLESGTIIDKLVKAVNRARGLPLKPLQRVNLILERIIPKYLYGLILCNSKVIRLHMTD